MKLEFSVRDVPWRTPLRTAHATSKNRPLVLVRIEATDGAVGYGEAAPLQAYDGVTLQTVLDALAVYRSVLAEGAGLAHAELLGKCSARAPLPQALAALDLALWDLAGRRAGRPVWALLGSEQPPLLECNATIGDDDPARAAAQAAAAVEHGFTCVKVKVGDRRSLQRVRAVRATVGSQVRLRLDANGAWQLEEALEALQAMRDANLELCEEPVHGVFAIAAVARALPRLAIAADETAGDPTMFRVRVCASLCLKISRCGGITGVMRDAVAARNAGYDAYLASTLDGPLGIAAALHVAAVVAPRRACGLATLDRFAGPPAPAALTPRNGLLSPPSGPGLGERLESWYEGI